MTTAAAAAAGARAAAAAAAAAAATATMMSSAPVHVYGVLLAADEVTPPDGARLLVHRDLAAVVADTPGDAVMAARALREHWRILEAIAAETTVLPVRFGTAMAGDDAVIAEYLEPEHDAL